MVPALAAGNTVVLKPSEVAPLSSLLFAELIDAAGFPRGSFNLVNGTGAVVGEALARHANVDMVSFTGSTRAGVAVSKAAADGVKRVSLELGGKGPNLIFGDLGVGGLRKAVGASLFRPEPLGLLVFAHHFALLFEGEVEETLVRGQHLAQKAKAAPVARKRHDQRGLVTLESFQLSNVSISR